jgi:Protein of unknwon function (DUF3310)
MNPVTYVCIGCGVRRPVESLTDHTGYCPTCSPSPAERLDRERGVPQTQAPYDPSSKKSAEEFHEKLAEDYKIAFGTSPAEHDQVNHPSHYTSHPSGVECIQITRHMGFNLGNALKYIWRADLKNGVEDLEKAIWYLQDEIAKRKKSSSRG